MYKRKNLLIWVFALLFLILTACSAQTDLLSTTQSEAVVTTSDDALADSTAAEVNVATAVSPSTQTVAEAAAANSIPLEDSDDYVWDSASVTQIALAGDAISVEGEGVEVNGRIATITAAGTYNLSGNLSEGQIIVDTADEEVVQLIFDGIEISNSSTAPIYVTNAEETVIILAEGSQNAVSDGANYVFASAEEDEPNAAVFSKDDLSISGKGSLTVEANYNDGIASKDGLIITSGTITVNAVDDGIRGKDYLIVKDGNITVTAQGDGLKSDEDEDATQGYITVEGGSITITSGGDAIQATTDVLISGGTFNLTAGGGSNGVLDADTSAKGIKGTVSVTIDGGSFTINSADDAIHSNDSLVINNGSFVIATGDDGLHADATLTLNGGVVQITESYEGIESALITINGGEFYVVASDDGINVAGGNDGSGFGPGGGGGPRPGGGFGGAAQDTFTTYTGDYYLYINGGTIVVDANGDGIDANGAIEMTDGTVIVNGPAEQMNGALDYDGTFTMSGGFLVTAGSSGMAQAPDVSSTQNALLLNLNGTLPAGTLINIQDGSGRTVLSFVPTKAYQSIAFSSPELVSGETYTVSYGGSDSGAMSDGLYQGGTYSSGTEYTSFTVTGTVTTIGNAGRR